MNKLTSFIIVIVMLCIVAPAAQAGRQLAVVVHPSCPLSTMNADAVKAHYLRHRKEWTDGSKVRPVQQETDARDGFLQRVLRMPVVEYERYWLERRYAAAESPPKSVDDDSDVIRFVGAMKGAIGFVDVSAIDDAARSKIKTVLTVAY